MSILGAVVFPHPPVILPQVGRGREQAIQATIHAVREAAACAASWKPDLIVLSSPHTILYGDYFHISPGPGAKGDLALFGAPQVQLSVVYDGTFRRELIRQAAARGLEAGTLGQRDPQLDHGTLLPLWFLREAGLDCPVVRLGLSGFSPLEHYKLGCCVRETAELQNKRVLYVASGDLSHKLTEDGPYGFDPQGPVFDAAVVKALSTGDFLSLLTLDPHLCERAAECGLRSFQIMAGALDGLAVQPRLLSHEGPLGVGYAVALFPVTGRDESRCLIPRYEEEQKRQREARRAGEDPWVRLARASLEHYLRMGEPLEELPEDLPRELTETSSGAFVSLHINGRLRGCIGTISPITSCTAREILSNAISAGTRDSRFPPVRVSELEDLEYSVDVLGQPEPIDGPEQLDVKRYGVIVTWDGRRGLLLPDLDGIDTPGQQISIAKEKAGIPGRVTCQLQRFEVVRHR